MAICPCGSNEDYLNCCGAFIIGHKTPKTPEELMRSRYTAYTQARIDYISSTMIGPAAKDFNKNEAEQWAKQVNWLGLEVLNTKSKKTRGWVEFIAHFSDAGTQHTLHEISEFHFKNGRWFYFDGIAGKSK